MLERFQSIIPLLSMVAMPWWCGLQWSCTEYRKCNVGHEKQFVSGSRTSACHGFFLAYLWHCFMSYMYTAKAWNRGLACLQSMLAEYSYSRENIHKDIDLDTFSFWQNFKCCCCSVLIHSLQYFPDLLGNIDIFPDCPLTNYSCGGAFESMASHGVSNS